MILHLKVYGRKPYTFHFFWLAQRRNVGRSSSLNKPYLPAIYLDLAPGKRWQSRLIHSATNISGTILCQAVCNSWRLPCSLSEMSLLPCFFCILLSTVPKFVQRPYSKVRMDLPLLLVKCIFGLLFNVLECCTVVSTTSATLGMHSSSSPSTALPGTALCGKSLLCRQELCS